MSAEDIANLITSLNQKCEGTIQSYKKDLQKVRTGRASSSLLENIQVDYLHLT